MAQEPSSRDLLEAVKQQESGGRRYKADGKTLLEGPPTKYGTAKGEMQVLDMTNRDPGFGVRPAKDDSADERARVGRDYLAAMKKRYGDTETGLIAYNWGPGNTDKWLKRGADPAKLPKETQNYVAKIMASLGGPDVSRETTAVAAAPKKAAPKPVAVAAAKKPAPVAAAPAAAPVTVASMDSKLADLGPSYQAALALSFLADTDEKEDRDIDREPGVAEKYLAEMEAAPRPAALSEFIDVKIRSPFAEAEQPEQPVGMAEGGEVEDRVEDPQMMANKTTELQGYKTKQPDGTDELWGPDVPVSRSAKELKAYTEALNPAVKTFTGGLGMGTRGYIYPDQPDIINLNTALTPGEREITTLHELEHSMDARGGDIYGRPTFAKMGGMDNNYRAYSLMGEDWSPITATVKNMVDNREKLEKFFGRPLDNSYFRKDSYDNLKKVGKTKALFSEQIASLAALEQTTGKFLTQDPEMRELFPSTKMMAVYDALTGPRQTRMDARDLPPHTPVPSYTYEQNPTLRFIKKSLTGENEYGTSYRPFPIKRAGGSPETGEVGYFQDPFGVPDSGPVTADTLSKGKEFSAADALRALKETGTGVARNIKNIAKGTTETPYNLVGSVADIGNMVLTPLGLGSAEPFLGSAQLKRLATEAGIRPAPPTDPRDAGYYMMGELGSSVLNPAGVVRSGVKAATKGKKAAEMLAKDFQAYNQALGPAGVSYAVRNKNTPFKMELPMSGEGKLVDEPLNYAAGAVRQAKEGITDLSETLKPEELVAMRAGDPDLEKWFMNRVPSYLRKDFGSPQDQFVKAAEEGKLLHFENKPSKYDKGKPLDFNTRERIKFNRKFEGFSPEGEAKEPYAKRVEDLIDASIYPARVEDLSFNQIPTSLRNADPSSRVTELAAYIDENLEFPNLYTEMARMRNMGPTYSAYGQSAVKIPEDYFISSKALEGLTLPQASQRVAQFKNWRTENRQRMASQAILNSPELQANRNILPNGTAAVYMPDLGENPKLMELVKDVGCDGGWCTKEESHALSFGSGDNELHLMVSPRGRPIAQLTLQYKGGKPGTAYGNMEMAGRFEEYLDKNPEKSVAFYAKARAKGAAVSDQYIVNTPEFKEYIRMYPSKVSISEIKSVGNKEELRDNPAISDIQKYIQRLDAEFNLNGIVGLKYTGLTELDPQLLMSGANFLASNKMYRMYKGNYSDSDFSTMRAMAAEDLRRKILRDNSGSKYFTTDEDGIKKIIQDAIDDLGGDAPKQRAMGGMVQGYAKGGIANGGMIERQFTDNRRYM